MDTEGVKIKQILRVFEHATNQQNCLEGIYSLFIPDWKKVKIINGWPVCSKWLWHFIAHHFQKYDLKHHPDCLPGGLWVNKGFSWRENLSPFEIDLSYCTISRSE